MRYTSATGTYTEKQLIRRYQEHHCVFLSWISLCRNLPHCVAEADSRQICTRWVSGQQCSRHKCPPNHWRAEGQQTPVLPEPVTLNSMTLIHSASPHPPLHHITCALFLFPLLCSRPTPSSLCPLFPFCLSLCFIQDFWTHSCSSLLPWKKTLRSLYVTWSVELFVESMWRFLQCRDEVVVAVLMKHVKLFELNWSSVLYREVVKYISMVTTRWCCVNKLQAVTPTWWSSIMRLTVWVF